jgi:hypothetical protein
LSLGRRKQWRVSKDAIEPIGNALVVTNFQRAIADRDEELNWNAPFRQGV